MIQKAIRDGFGEALAETGIKDQRIVVLSGDLEDSTKAINFKNAVPKRFYNLGIAEQDLVGTAAGMSREGFIPFVCSFAVFLTNRAYDQIRVTVCYNNFNVKLVASHGGVTVGSDGATAQCLEDFAIMRVLPNMKVICPCDAVEVKKAVKALPVLIYEGPLSTIRDFTAFLTSTASQRQITFMFGNTLIIAKSSRHCAGAA